MESWLFWLIAAVILGLGEIATLGFVLAPFAGGALIAALAAAFGGGTAVELATFLVTSIALLGLLRPIARSHRKTPLQIRTGTAALIGKGGTVTERVDVDHGAVRIDGEVWTARPYDESDVFEPGTRVSIVQIKGAIALVSE